MRGKCPSCERELTSVTTRLVRVESAFPVEQAMTLCCPECSTVLGCQADPVAIRDEIKKAIEDAFRQRGML